MSNVVISNRSILNQRITSIDKNRVNLPFNVTKEQISKLMNLLTKVKLEFKYDLDKLDINNLTYNNMQIKGTRKIADSKFSLSKSYIVTMKQTYVSKVREFYNRIVEEIKVERPIFDIGEETNLQQALKEATAEIDLSELQKTNVVLANSQMENKELQVDSSIIADNVEPVQSQVIQPVEPTPVVNPEANTTIAPPQTILTEQPTPIVNQTPIVEQQPIANQQPVIQPQMVQTPQEYVENSVMPEQPKIKKRIFSRKGNVLIVPVIVLWLGLVLFGSIKIVTNILT